LQTEKQGSLLILGLGNVICADDGLGVVAVERLRRRYALPPEVRALDGGTLGLSLLGQFGEADDVILVDAVKIDARPGTRVRFNGDTVGRAVRERLSVHQIGVADLLDALRWMDALPRRLVLLGLVPRSVELSMGRSPEVEAALPSLVRAVAEEAREMGYSLRRRRVDEEVPAGAGDVAARALGL
jgi:hydrogenase maturation protease